MLAKALTASVFILAGSAGSVAGDADHRDYVARVAAYKPMQAFNHVVGEKQFVGYFLAAEDACEVTVMVAIAGDERLAVAPKRVDLVVRAADRAEIEAGRDSVLAIGCTSDADMIKIVALSRTGEPQPAPRPGA